MNMSVAEASIVVSYGSQILLLPDEIAFPDQVKEVIIERIGKPLIMTPVDEAAEPSRRRRSAVAARRALPIDTPNRNC